MSSEGSENYLSDWVWIDKLSQELLDLANEQKWDELQKLADERNSCLKQFFKKDVPPEYVNEISAGINKIQKLDEQITALARETRSSIGQELLTMSKTKQAQKAYNDNK